MAYKTSDWREVGERIKKERKRLGLSLDFVANECGLQQYQTVSNWERADSTPSLSNLLKLCSLFGCELGYLLGEEGYEQKTRAKTDIHKATGLSEEAINELVKHNSEYSEETAILSELISNPQMWRTLREIISAKELKSVAQKHPLNGHETLINSSTGRVTLFGQNALDNTTLIASIRFYNIIREMIGGENNG